ncbi:Phospholipid/glycerol acyltransferase [gamma proteobacterium HdN1]|nr:Phospholipid/glycerol acyltransferase [gamma proteobacterium HdN1]
MSDTTGKQPSQFRLLGERRFAPFFWTQFCGAFNDNVFKNALLLWATFGVISTQVDIHVINNVAAGLFILPFFLFSALAGQVADKLEKGVVIRTIKLAEIAIMGLAVAGFYLASLPLLLLTLFLMGTHSAFFGPVKYSIIPQHLKKEELVGGNALVESGTFVAILLGTLLAGLLSKLNDSAFYISCAVIGIAMLGYWNSRRIPLAPAADRTIQLNFNPWKETLATMRFSRQNRAVFLSILGISWFWFLGAAYLTQLPAFVKEVLQGDQTVVTLLLAVFSIGIAAGSLLCEKLSDHKIELGLVPFGSIGLTLFGIDLYSHSNFPAHEVISVGGFLAQPGGYRVMLDFIGIGIFGGFYIVPLYAMVQARSAPESRSRIIASLNIFNAVFMVVSAIAGVLLLGVAKLSILQFFLILALMNVVVAGYIYTVIPEFTMRFLIWMITHTMYRVTHKDLGNIPEEGACVVVCNHVSYMDALLIAGACRRPIRFVMFKPIYDLPVLNFIFRTGKAIPIHSRQSDPETYERAFASISRELQDGEVVCIFPEGKLTTTGEIDEFKNGVEKILAQNPVPVVPMALRGLWGSFFSHKDGSALTRMPRRFWSRVQIVAGDAIPAEKARATFLQEQVQALRGEMR